MKIDLIIDTKNNYYIDKTELSEENIFKIRSLNKSIENNESINNILDNYTKEDFCKLIKWTCFNSINYTDFKKFIEYLFSLNIIENQDLFQCILKSFDEKIKLELYKKQINQNIRHNSTIKNYLSKIDLIINIANSYPELDYTRLINFEPLNFRMLENYQNFLMYLLKHKNIKPKVIGQFVYELIKIKELSTEFIELLLEDNIDYIDFKYLIKYIEDNNNLSKKIIEISNKKNNSINLVFYICLIKNIENNIDIKNKDINLSYIINKLTIEKEELINIDIKKLSIILEIYINSSEEKNKKLNEIEKLFISKEKLKDKLDIYNKLINF